MQAPKLKRSILCVKRKDDYGIALYSYTLPRQCSRCWGHGYWWVLYYILTVSIHCNVHTRAISFSLSPLGSIRQIVVYNTCSIFEYLAMHTDLCIAFSLGFQIETWKSWWCQTSMWKAMAPTLACKIICACFHWMLQLSSGPSTFTLMTTGAFSWNIKLFTELKLVPVNLFIHADRSQLRSMHERKCINMTKTSSVRHYYYNQIRIICVP